MSLDLKDYSVTNLFQVLQNSLKMLLQDIHEEPLVLFSVKLNMQPPSYLLCSIIHEIAEKIIL